MPSLCLVLAAPAPSHAAGAHEAVVGLFQALVNADVCLLPASTTDADAYLAAALPTRDLLSQVRQHSRVKT